MKKQKTENLKTNKGITLIALVITIIVMLILVAVTISMAVNGGLFEYASNAGAQTNTAVDAEQEFANLEANMTVDGLIDKYTQSSNGENCKRCTDGYVTGYVCGNYGRDCKAVNSNYVNAGFFVSCWKCEIFRDYFVGENVEEWKCPKCGGPTDNPDSIKYVQLSECLHYRQLSGIEEERYPCPECSMIGFSIDGDSFFAPKGSTWSYITESNKEYEVRDNGYILKDMGSLVLCTSDGKRVKVSSEILNGHSYKWTIYIQCNCTDGYVYGYKCDREDCDEISSGWDKFVTLYEGSCKFCGISVTSEYDGEFRCPKCGSNSMYYEKEWIYDLYGCNHDVSVEPELLEIPCPICSNE